MGGCAPPLHKQAMGREKAATLMVYLIYYARMGQAITFNIAYKLWF
jgi:hypothetical protein